MARVKLLLLLQVAYLVYGQEVSPDPVLNRFVATADPAVSCNFFDVVAASPLGPNVMTLKDQIVTSISAVEAFTVDLKGQTDRLPTLVMRIKTIGVQALSMVKNLIDTFERMVTDRTVPVQKLLELFEKPYKALKKFHPEFIEPFINDISEYMGCTMASDVKFIFKSLLHQANQIASIVERLEAVVKDPCRRQKDMVQLVRVLANRIEKINAIVMDANNFFTSAATGITKAVSLLTGIDTIRTQSLNAIKNSRDVLRLIAITLRDSALNDYISGLETIRTNLTASITTLSVFEPSRKLGKLTKHYEISYLHLFQFLREQNRTDITNIRQYYRSIVKNMESASTAVADKFLDAAFRTALKLVDIVLERSPDSDTCFGNYSVHVAEPFAAIPELLLSCIAKEPPRWEKVIATFNSSVGLLNITYEHLAQNIASCSRFTNYTIDNHQYLQAKACLKTNLQDLNHLVKVLKPQLEVIDRAFKLDVDVSKFRLDNCLANLLHNKTAEFKVIRTRIDRCAGRIDDCPRKNRDDDGNDWYNRYGNEHAYADESDETSSSEKVSAQFFRNGSTVEDSGEEVSYEINSEEDVVAVEQ